jgi:IS6 family transposase
MRRWPPHSMTTDKLGSYSKAIHRLQRERRLSGDTKHRTSKYQNNIIEADHGGIKRFLRPTPWLSNDEGALRHDQRFEVMRMIRRRQCILCQPSVAGEIQFVNTVFWSRCVTLTKSAAALHPWVVNATKPSFRGLHPQSRPETTSA